MRHSTRSAVWVESKPYNRILGRLSRSVMLSALLMNGGVAWPVLALANTVASGSATSTGSTVPSISQGQSHTLLPDGRWLLLGGEGDKARSARVFDPVSGVSTALRSTLLTGRAYHSATVLPDGTVFVFGGLDAQGNVLNLAERFDPLSGSFSAVNQPGLTGRARHTATLLTDGRVLLVGGVADHDHTESQAELWNPQTQTGESFSGTLTVPRSDHTAELLATAPVLISGGRDAADHPVTLQEAFDPIQERFLVLGALSPSLIPPANWAGDAPHLVESIPQAQARDVALDARLVLRFSKPLLPSSLSAATVTLLGPNAVTPARVVAAEGGLLLFVKPVADLLPASWYSLVVSGAKDEAGRPLPETVIGFQTRTLNQATPSTSMGAGTPGATSAATKSNSVGASATSAATAVSSSAGAEMWFPDGQALRGDWRSRRQPSPLQQLPPLAAPSGTTALAGQVLLLDGSAGTNVTLRMGDVSVLADNTGRFVLPGVTPGFHTLQIDGHTADTPGKTYGFFEARVLVGEAGQTTSLPYTLWMPRIDDQQAAPVTSPTPAEVIITTPHIPGLELHIPKGTVIRDRTGKVVTSVSITPIPVDRTPFPLPLAAVPVYFTVQPGSAHVESIDPASTRGAWLIYPNYTGERPGTRMDFWSYDPVTKGWYVYGQGRVTADGQQVMPDANVALYEFTGAMVSLPSNAPPEGPVPGGCPKPECKADGTLELPCAFNGDPVDCYTGLFVHRRTDLVVADTIPISVTRTYRPRDSRSRAFGIGTNLEYDMFTVGDTHPYTYQDLILPDGGRIHYTRISPGTDMADAVYEHKETNTRFFGSVLKFGGALCSWRLTLKDGTHYCFPEAEGATNPRIAAVGSMGDRYGNTLTFDRSLTSGNLTRITSPNGRYIDFTYDTGNRITRAQDNSGRYVAYQYDASGRLWKATNAEGGVEEYTYDSSDRMLTVKKPSGDIMVTNVYDANGRVQQQTLADGGVYQFAYTLNGSGKVIQTDITDPRNKVKRLTFNAAGYVLTETFAVGTSEQQARTFERDASTNLVTATVDALSRRTEYTYDGLGNMLSVTRLAGTGNAVTESFTYESQYSQLASHTDPLSHTTTYAYDSQGSLISLVDPLGHEISFQYTSTGLITSITDPLNHSLSFAYDGGDMSSKVDPLGRITTFFTDSLGRVTSVGDPLGNRTQYSYDNLDRINQIADAANGVTAFGYDANSNLTSLTDSKGGITAWAYDAKDRISSRTDQLGRSESYLYDGNDNLIRFTDRRGKIASYTYDALNRRTKSEYGQELQGQNLTSPDATVNATWDGGNRISQISDTQGGTIAWVYDGLDRVTRETTSQGQIDYAYDGASRRTSMTVLGQSAVNYTFDNANRMTQISQGSQTAQYGFDDAGRRTTLTLPNGLQAAYSYDSAGQLTGISYAMGGTALGDLNYTYSVSGQRTQVGGSLAKLMAPTTVASATYNAANQLTSWGGIGWSYDNSGSLIGDGGKTYTWDSRQRLSSISGAVAAGFSYDALNRRTQTSIAGGSTSYLLDGVSPVQEIHGGQIYNLLNGESLDEVIARRDPNGVAQYFIADMLGSTNSLVDASGVIQAQFAFAPFGETTAVGTASNDPFQYAGRENDGTGLYYYRARYYDPVKGRFISPDPIGFSGGINEYAYVGGSPISASDPFGLWTASLGWGGNLGWGYWGGSASAGLIIDGNGNIGLYGTVATGPGIGLEGGTGATLSVTDAQNISDTRGVAYGANVSLGAGIGGAVGGSRSIAPNGSTIHGMTLTGGVGAGVSVGLERSNTGIMELGNFLGNGKKKPCP